MFSSSICEHNSEAAQQVLCSAAAGKHDLFVSVLCCITIVIARLHKIGGEEQSFIMTVLQSVVFVSRRQSANPKHVHPCKVVCISLRYYQWFEPVCVFENVRV